jgi:S1-C subfamily serine protease
LLLILVVLSAVAFLPTYLEQLRYRQAKGEIAAINEALPDSQAASFGKMFTMLARKVSHSVVHIKTQRSFRGGRDEFFAILGPQVHRQRGEASGVIVDEAGYIVTNYHVIAKADTDDIEVRLANGQTYRAEIVGSDAKNDLAVLKIEADNLIPLPWGNSDNLEVGEMVWALGNPFGLDNTLTFGIISGKDRRGVNAASTYQEFLQTDAAVNPGNSGGPLVNMMGEIVGINTAILGPTFQGISFAIPSNIAKRIYQQIRENGEVVNGFLGVGLETRNDRLARQLGVEQIEGALVLQVQDGSPAAKAGIEPGDLIIAWDGEKIGDPQELFYNVSRAAPGTKVTLTVIREEREMKLTVTVGRRPPENREQ